MGPHLIWAGVVLLLAAGAFVAVRSRWRNLEELSGKLDGTRHRLETAESRLGGLQVEINADAVRIGHLEMRLAELEPVVKALSAAGSPVKPVPQRRV